MPTDPFVAPQLDDAPRHKQNLPPGIGLPPARPWRAARAGDSASAGTGGEQFGAPGPNVGYALTLARRECHAWRLAPHEHDTDAVAVVAEIAMKRASGFHRGPVIGDVQMAAILLGYDGPEDPGFAPTRARVVHEAAHHYAARRAIVDAIPVPVLRLKASEAFTHAAEIRAALESLVKS